MSPEEVRRLIEHHRPLLRVMAWQLHRDPRLKRRFDGSDIVHEAMVRATEGLANFRGVTEAELMRWLQEVLHNAFFDMVRRELAGRRTPNMEASLGAMCRDSTARLEGLLAARQSSPSQQAERQEVLVRFAAAVERLPDDQRDVVLLRDVQHLPIKEIAELTGRTEKAVAGLLRRGREALRAAFPDYREGADHV